MVRSNQKCPDICTILGDWHKEQGPERYAIISLQPGGCSGIRFNSDINLYYRRVSIRIGDLGDKICVHACSSLNGITYQHEHLKLASPSFFADLQKIIEQ